MTKTRKLVLGAAAVLIGLAAVAIITSRSTQADSAHPAIAPVAVEVTLVGRDTLAENVSAVGTIEAMRDVEVGSETAGRITQVLVKVGDKVREGQPLVVVDHELQVIAVEQARAQLQAAETTFRKAEKDFDRAKTLYASGDIADVEIEGNRLALHSAEAQYKGAQVALKAAERQLKHTRITSPVHGRVAARFVEQGEMVAPTTKIANVVDVSKVKVKLSIPEEEIVRVRPGMEAAMQIDALPERVFPGVVYTVGSKAENQTGHTYPVEVVVENSSPDFLKVGMFARVDIRIARAEGVLSVSKESLVSEGHDASLFVVENDVAHLRHVTLGIRTPDRYQVTDGLKEGDRVVSFGQKALKDGAPVREN